MGFDSAQEVEERTTLLAKLELMDRRILYGLIIICVIVPLVTGMQVPVAVSRYSQDLFDLVESLPADSNVLYIFHPSFWGETRSMFTAMWKHLMVRTDINVIAFGNSPAGMGYWTNEVKPILEEEGLIGPGSGRVYGEDWVWLGYIPGTESMYRSMAGDFRSMVTEDGEGTPIDDLPVIANIIDAHDFTAVVDGEGYAIERSYRQFGPPTAYKCTMINVGMSSCIAKYVPWIEAGEIYEMPGIRGGGEYEQLISAQYGFDPWLGTKFLASTTLSHTVLLIFLIVGNVIYFIRRSRGEVK
jgi:hypothetical protein